MTALSYRTWKEENVRRALRTAGIEMPIEGLIDAHGEGRRRVTLHARHPGPLPSVGFMAARSHEVIEIDLCPIAEAMLSRHAPIVAAKLAASLAATRKPLDIQITATDSGLDVDLRGLGPLKDSRTAAPRRPCRGARPRAPLPSRRNDRRAPSARRQDGPRRRRLAAGIFFAGDAPWRGNPCPTGRGGLRQCAGDRGSFLGLRAFSLRLAERAKVHAVEADRGAIAALDKAARSTAGLRQVTSEVRDLFRRPLLSPELTKFDAVVLDPPRAGAEAQARQLATAKVPLVVSVSCDPGTFARDAAILIAGGYRLERVATVDQFKYSPHVELVGVLRRDGIRKTRPPSSRARRRREPGTHKRRRIRNRRRMVAINPEMPVFMGSGLAFGAPE